MPTPNWKYGWSDSVSEGGKKQGEGGRGWERKHTCLLSKKDRQLCFFPPLIMVEMYLKKNAKSNLSPSLFCLLLFYSWSWVGVLYWNYSLRWKLAACKMSLHSHFFRHIHHLIFPNTKVNISFTLKIFFHKTESPFWFNQQLFLEHLLEQTSGLDINKDSEKHQTWSQDSRICNKMKRRGLFK